MNATTYTLTGHVTVIDCHGPMSPHLRGLTIEGHDDMGNGVTVHLRLRGPVDVHATKPIRISLTIPVSGTAPTSPNDRIRSTRRSRRHCR